MDQHHQDYQLIGDPPGDNEYIPPHYDPHVPPGWTIQSGGGIANAFGGGGYWGGPYSERASRSDVYGDSLPLPNIGGQQDTITDMYDGTGLAKMSPWTASDYEQMREHPYGKPETGNIDYPYGYQVLYNGGVERFTTENDPNSSSDYELIESPDVQMIKTSLDEMKKQDEKKAASHPIVVFVLIILLFLTIDVWIQAGNHILKTRFFKDKKMGTWHYVSLALGVTVILFLVAHFTGLSLNWFERRA